jgi:hypothetical protein
MHKKFGTGQVSVTSSYEHGNKSLVEVKLVLATSSFYQEDLWFMKLFAQYPSGWKNQLTFFSRNKT